MTAKNRKQDAKEVDVFPQGRVFRQEGNCSLIETGKNESTWYKLKPIPNPEEVKTVECFPKEATIARSVGNLFQFHDGTWVKLVKPENTTKLKTMFQVGRLFHSVVAEDGDCVFIRYNRDRSTEWVQKISTPPAQKRQGKEARRDELLKA